MSLLCGSPHVQSETLRVGKARMTDVLNGVLRAAKLMAAGF